MKRKYDSSAEYIIDSPVVPTDATGSDGTHPLHRLAAVRRAKHLSRSSLARWLHVSISDITCQEQATTDLPLSMLYRWAAALRVPVVELLVEPDAVFTRDDWAHAARWLATAQAILGHNDRPAVKRLSQTFIDQLLEMVPALEEISRRRGVERPRHGADKSSVVPQELGEEVFVAPSVLRQSPPRTETPDNERRHGRRKPRGKQQREPLRGSGRY